LAHLKRLGTPMILREVLPPTDKRYVRLGAKAISKPYSFSGMQKIVQRMRKEIGLPSTFTLDACRHGGMTELEEAELTEDKVEPYQRTARERATLGMPNEPRRGF